MRSILAAVAGLCLIAFHNSALAQLSQANGAMAARIALVREFVRELEVLYSNQETAKTEFAEDPSNMGKLMTSIRVGTRILLAMNESIERLNMIALPPDWAKFRDLLKQMDQQRIGLVEEQIKTSKTFLEAPQPGVNYGALVARAPELTAQMEAVDKNIFTMSQAMFFALVDDSRLGPDGNLHHLIVTEKERANIVHDIDTAFGASLEDKNASSIVNAAWAIKYGLTRPIYKAADEP